MPRIPIDEMSGWPPNSNCCTPSVVTKRLGVFASAVELFTMPTISSLRDPTSSCSPIWRPIVLDTASSSGLDGALPSDIAGIPGPPAGAPNMAPGCVESPFLNVAPLYASGAAATTPGVAATTCSSAAGNGAEPRNGPVAPDLIKNMSTPRESTVRSSSTRNPLASPVRTSVIANTRPVTTIAITKRHLRHCMSRNAVNSMISTNLSESAANTTDICGK